MEKFVTVVVVIAKEGGREIKSEGMLWLLWAVEGKERRAG